MRAVRENLLFPQLVTKFYVFHCRVHKSPPLFRVPSETSPLLQTSCLEIQCSSNLLSIPGSSNRSLCFSFLTKTSCVFLFSSLIFFCFGRANNICLWVKLARLFTLQFFSHTPFTSYPLCPNFFLSNLMSNILSPVPLMWGTKICNKQNYSSANFNLYIFG